MKANNIHSQRKRACKATANSKHSYPVAPNLLKRNFAPLVLMPSGLVISLISLRTWAGYIPPLHRIYARRRWWAMPFPTALTPGWQHKPWRWLFAAKSLRRTLFFTPTGVFSTPPTHTDRNWKDISFVKACREREILMTMPLLKISSAASNVN